MDSELCLVLEDDYAEVIDQGGDAIWNSDDDDDFDYDDGMSAEDIIAYLVRAEVIGSEKEIGEVVEDRGNLNNDDSDDDEEADEDNEE